MIFTKGGYQSAELQTFHCSVESSPNLYFEKLFLLKVETIKFQLKKYGGFIQSRKYMSLKLTGELCVMTMKNYAKFKKELSCQLKIDMRNSTNFDPSTPKSQTFAL